MSKHIAASNLCRSPWQPLLNNSPRRPHPFHNLSAIRRHPQPGIRNRKKKSLCNARRRARYSEDEDNEADEHGHNAEISMLESYTQSAGDEVLLVRATVDGQEEEILVFKGFSSSLSFGTSPDPAKSVLPARAVIKSVDRIKGPLDPSKVEYIERGLTWEAFRARLQPPANPT